MAVVMAIRYRDLGLICLLVPEAILLAYGFFGFPVWLSRVMLLSNVQTRRLLFSLGYLDVVMLVRAVAVGQSRDAAQVTRGTMDGYAQNRLITVLDAIEKVNRGIVIDADFVIVANLAAKLLVKSVVQARFPFGGRETDAEGSAITGCRVILRFCQSDLAAGDVEHGRLGRSPVLQLGLWGRPAWALCRRRNACGAYPGPRTLSLCSFPGAFGREVGVRGGWGIREVSPKDHTSHVSVSTFPKIQYAKDVPDFIRYLIGKDEKGKCK